MSRAPADDGAPAYYARRRVLGSQRLGDAWTLLHPPYTAWHLAYVVIGACLVPPVSVARLLAALGAFFLAVGVGAHALDELAGRPLRTSLSDGVLVAAAVAGLAGAVALGVVGVVVVGAALVPFIVLGLVLALGYNLELFGGVLHNDATFALAWGGFPVLCGFVAEHDAIDLPAIVACLFGVATALAQRRLSTPARTLRRRTRSVTGELVELDGGRHDLDVAALRAPLESSLRALSVAMAALAAALALARLHP